MKTFGGRWSLGSIALEMQVRFVSRAQATELFASYADPARCLRGAELLPEAAMPVVPRRAAPATGFCVAPACEADSTPAGSTLGDAKCAPAPDAPSAVLLPILLRQRPAAGAAKRKVKVVTLP